MQLRLLIDNNFHSKTYTFANFFQESQFQLVQNREIHFALRVLPLFPSEALLAPDPSVGKPLDLSTVHFCLFSCHLKLIMTMFSICKLEPNNIIPSEKKPLPRFCSGSAQWPVMPYFCSWVMKKSNFFEEIMCWVPFSFS